MKPGQYVVLTVRDTGAGMSAEVQGRAIEPFFTTKRMGNGSGLGLSMVYGFVKQSRGHVDISSKPGKGTTVNIYLPRSHGVPEALSERPIGSARQGRGETILVVEDEDDVRALAVGLLTNLGYRPLDARDAESALTVLEETPEIALMFTDVVLPGGMSGPDLAREAQRRRPDLKVLYTSGYTNKAVARHGCLDKGVELIGKPYRIEGLAQTLGAMLDWGEA